MPIPQLRAEPRSTEARQGDLYETIQRRADEALRTHTSMDVLERLGLTRSSATSSPEGLMKGVGDLVAGMGKGYQSLTEMSQALTKQAIDLRPQGQGSEPMTQLVLGMMGLLMKALAEREGGSAPSEWQQRYLARLEEEIRELKGRQGLSPIDMQMQELTQSMAVQAFQRAADPLSGLKELAQSRDTLKEVFGSLAGGAGEYSEGALRMRAIERDERAVELQHLDTVARLGYQRDMMQHAVPTWIATGGDVLRNVLSSYGLAPIYEQQVGQGRQFSDRARQAAGQEA